MNTRLLTHLAYCLSLVVLLTAALVFSSPVNAQKRSVICVNKKSQRLFVRPRCKRAETVLNTRETLIGEQGVKGDKGEKGEVGPAGPQGETGPQGTQGTAGSQGATGADGMDSAWGDGSAGNVSVDGDKTLEDDNTQYANFTVSAGITLTVPSSTIIRATGVCTIDGHITVTASGYPGTIVSASLDTPYHTTPQQGISLYPAQNGRIRSGNLATSVASAGRAAGESIARFITRPPLFFGGGGGDGLNSGVTITSGAGGGSVALYCKEGIDVAGSIKAGGGYGGNCRGSGGGGGIILASSGPVTTQAGAEVWARGTTGGTATSSCCSGGGGGGGLIHILAPTINLAANTTSVVGGDGVASRAAGTVTGNPWSSGGGGGASIGAGGNSASVAADGSCSASSAGDAGVVLQRIVDNPAGIL